MGKFSVANIKKNTTGRNLLEVLKMTAVVAAAEYIPGAVQAIGGYKADGTPNIPASGPIWDATTGIGAAAVAYGFDKPQYGNAILLTKGVKATYNYLNPVLFKTVGTGMLPSGSNQVIGKNVGMESNTEGPADSVPVYLPDGSVEQVPVTSKPQLSGYDVNEAVEMLSEGNTSPFLTNLSDVYTNDPLQDIYTNNPLQEQYTNNPLQDIYTNEALQDIYTDNPLSDEMDFFDQVAEGEFE